MGRIILCYFHSKILMFIALQLCLCSLKFVLRIPVGITVPIFQECQIPCYDFASTIKLFSKKSVLAANRCFY